MKAESTLSAEISISLSQEEISLLEKEVLNGKIAIRGPKLKLLKTFSLKIGQVKKGFLIDLYHIPQEADFLNSREYKIILTKQAYSLLRERGLTEERISTYSKIEVFNRNVLI